MEEWRVIEGYNNYSVSNLGKVRNDKRGNILKGIIQHGEGRYLRVGLYDNNIYHKPMLIHRLVAIAFLPNPENLPEVDHIDRNSQNNTLENLRWCSKANNLRNKKKREGTTSLYRGISWNKYHSKWIAQIILNGKNKYIGRFETEEDAYEAWRACVFEHNLQEFYGL
jgi:hypothetical protein